MATKPAKPKAKKASTRSRYQFDLTEEDRARWEKAIAKQSNPMASFIRSAVEEKIRRDGLA